MGLITVVISGNGLSGVAAFAGNGVDAEIGTTAAAAIAIPRTSHRRRDRGVCTISCSLVYELTVRVPMRRDDHARTIEEQQSMSTTPAFMVVSHVG
jgi:hypothetical protein